MPLARGKQHGRDITPSDLWQVELDAYLWPAHEDVERKLAYRLRRQCPEERLVGEAVWVCEPVQAYIRHKAGRGLR